MRRVVRAFGPIEHVVALQITNEVNIAFSPNTSDGAYANAVEALARGVPAAKREARRLGYDQLRTGFNYAWRFGDGDADFWRAVGAAGGKRLRRATDGVGIDTYPGTFVPRRSRTPATPCSRRSPRCASATCRWPASAADADPPRGARLPDRARAQRGAQAEALTSFVKTVNRYRGTYNVTNLNWFGLRDNNSEGPNFQSFFGLLRDDYSRKPAFGAYRG